MEVDSELGEIQTKRAHFNATERALLVDLVGVYKDILENKKTGRRTY